MKKNKKSPLKQQPLHHAGQSLDEEIIHRQIDKIEMYASMAAVLFVMALLEWYRSYTNMPPQPMAVTLIVSPIIAFFLYLIYREKQHIKKLKLGRDGERIVGQYLEAFREAGMKVHHDIVGEGFNLDHLIIGTKGVYLIETKTYSKPSKGKTEIEFDGQDFYYNGAKNIDDAIQVQVAAGSAWLRDLIEELTTKRVDVKPVVLFPGWYVKMTRKHHSNIWALNPKGLHTFLNKQKEILSKEDVQLISNHIARYMRSR